MCVCVYVHGDGLKISRGAMLIGPFSKWPTRRTALHLIQIPSDNLSESRYLALAVSSFKSTVGTVNIRNNRSNYGILDTASVDPKLTDDLSVLTKPHPLRLVSLGFCIWKMLKRRLQFQLFRGSLGVGSHEGIEKPWTGIDTCTSTDKRVMSFHEAQ